MKKSYSNKIWEISGVKVVSKEEAITDSGKFSGQKYWRLIIDCETHPEIRRVCIFDSKVGTAGEVGAEEIINDIKNSNYADKRYLFYCYKRSCCKWDLAGWKLLENK